jgi:acetyl-CoA synthetase
MIDRFGGMCGSLSSAPSRGLLAPANTPLPAPRYPPPPLASSPPDSRSAGGGFETGDVRWFADGQLNAC